MDSKTISLNLTSGGGRQTLPDVDRKTGCEVITTWSNNATASDESVITAPIMWDTDLPYPPYDSYCDDGGDWTGSIVTDIPDLGEPDIYLDNVIVSDPYVSWWWNSPNNNWHIGIERASFPYTGSDYQAVIGLQFSNGQRLNASVLIKESS